MQYDSVSCGVGSGIYIWVQLEMVSDRYGFFMAAEHMFYIYSVIGILLFTREKEIQKRPYRVWGRCIDFCCDGSFYAAEPDTVWRLDAAWKLYADCGIVRENW